MNWFTLGWAGCPMHIGVSIHVWALLLVPLFLKKKICFVSSHELEGISVPISMSERMQSVFCFRIVKIILKNSLCILAKSFTKSIPSNHPSPPRRLRIQLWNYASFICRDRRAPCMPRQLVRKAEIICFSQIMHYYVIFYFYLYNIS